MGKPQGEKSLCGCSCLIRYFYWEYLYVRYLHSGMNYPARRSSLPDGWGFRRAIGSKLFTKLYPRGITFFLLRKAAKFWLAINVRNGKLFFTIGSSTIIIRMTDDNHTVEIRHLTVYKFSPPFRFFLRSYVESDTISNPTHAMHFAEKIIERRIKFWGIPIDTPISLLFNSHMAIHPRPTTSVGVLSPWSR